MTAEPVLPDHGDPAPAAQLAPPAVALPPLPEIAGGPGGAALCFAEPVHAGGRTLVPVAHVRTRGGRTDARPVGVLEVSDAGVRLERLDDPRADRPARLVAAAVGLLSGAALMLGARLRAAPPHGPRRPWRR